MVRLIVALLPLALVPVVVGLIADGPVDFGGGEMDLVLVLPTVSWSLLFAISSRVLWYRGWPMARSIVWSAVLGFVGVLIAAAMLAAFGQLGVAGF